MTNTTNQPTKKINKISTLIKLQTLYNIGKIDFRYNRITKSELSELQSQLEQYLINNIILTKTKNNTIKTDENGYLC